MKSKIKQDKKQKIYPRLMSSNEEQDLVVLFYREGQGMVVNPGDAGNYYVGHHSVAWNHESYWTDFEGQVILSND